MLIRCPHCQTSVWVKSDGQCPSCRKTVPDDLRQAASESAGAAAAVSTGTPLTEGTVPPRRHDAIAAQAVTDT
jgi:hypothetical protein